MKQLIVKINLLSQAIASDSGVAGIMSGSKAFISGTMVRGMLAAAYIRNKDLGQKAHEDPGFQLIFYGDISFLPATLWDAAAGKKLISP